MPEHVEGLISVPSCGDSEQTIKDTLARLEAKIDRLAEQLADAEAEAEEIMRRATAPAMPAPPRRRRGRGDGVLRLVQAVAITAIGLGVILAACAAVRPHTHRAAVRCPAACARAAAHRDAVADA